MNEQEIYIDAMSRSEPDDRRRFLDEACGDNLDLRQRLDVLFRQSDELGSFLESPPSDFATPTVIQSLPEKPGAVIGPYKLREQIGEGGMGVVYMAEQRQPVRRMVALKIIKPGMDTREVIARFDAERQALALMDHPHIARILDAGATEAGRPYFVMDLVKGVPITRYCDQQQLGLRRRLELFVTVCRAVQHAHQKGVIHRDLKPTNVLVERHDVTAVPKVIDFGVAKAICQRLTERSLFTQFAQLIGTPLYMSPEQAQLTGLDVDTRSDVYSLGVLLYELLTGTTPFDKEALRNAGYDEIRRIIQEQEPPKPSNRISTLGASLQTVSDCRTTDPRRLGPIVRGELDWIVMQALEKDRNRRYESASALAADVERYLNDEAVEACPPTKAYRLRKYARCNKTDLVTVTLVLASLLAGTGVSAWQAVEANQQRREAESGRRDAQDQREIAVLAGKVADQQRQSAVEERNSAVQQRKLALSNQYNAEIVSGQADWERGNIGSLHRKLVRHLPVEGESDRRGWEWYYLFSLCHPEERTLFQSVGLSFASWSPDGEYVATAGSVWSARSGVCVRRISTSRILRHQVAWSPNGQKFAWGMCADDNGIYIWDRSTDQVSSLHGHESSVWCLDWSPDGTQLASGSLDGTARIWDVAQEITVRTFPDLGHTVTSVAWSPDGELIAAGLTRYGVKVWRVSDAKLVAEKQEAAFTRVSWHPDGQQLAVCTNNSWSLLRRSDWSVIREPDHTTGGGKDIAWNPDGTRLAVAHGEVVKIWDPANDQPLATLRGHLGQVVSLAWSPDGTRLVTSDSHQEVRIWNWNSPVQPAPILTGRPLKSLDWLDDGQTLVTIGAEDDDGASFWDASEGRQLRVEQPEAEGSVRWSPNRRLWAVRTGTEENPEVQILDASTGAVHSIWRGSTQHRLHKFVWSPDAAMLAIETTFDGHIKLEFWDVDGEATLSSWRKEQLKPAVRVSNPTEELVAQIVWSNDSTHVAVAARGDPGDNGTYAWNSQAHVIDVATGQRILKHILGGRRLSVRQFAWSPDGQALACGGSTGLIDVLDIDTGHILVSSKPHNRSIRSLAWSPDGRQLATASRDGDVKIIGTTDGAELLTFPFEDEAPEHLTWSPDGQQLAAATESGAIHIWDARRGYEFSDNGSRRAELAGAYYQRALARGRPLHRPALHEFLRLAPDTLGYWESRGHARARLGEFELAAHEFAKAIGPNLQLSFGPAWDRTFALLGAGDLDVYREVCASLVEEFRDSDVPSNRRCVAWLCALSPDPPAGSKAVLQMARAIHEHESPDDFGDFGVLGIGASLVRNEQYDEAIGTLTELADKLDQGGDTTDHYELACAQYFIALARHQQGHDFQARRHLDEAVCHTEVYRAVDPYWRRIVVLDALQRETEAALSEP